MSCKSRKIKLYLHVNLRVCKSYSMHFLFIKCELKVIRSGHSTLFLGWVGSHRKFSCPSLLFLIFSHKKFSCHCVSFCFNYCYYWSWVVRTVNVQLCFNHIKITPMVRTRQANTFSESLMWALKWSSHLTIKTK